MQHTTSCFDIRKNPFLAFSLRINHDPLEDLAGENWEIISLMKWLFPIETSMKSATKRSFTKEKLLLEFSIYFLSKHMLIFDAIVRFNRGKFTALCMLGPCFEATKWNSDDRCTGNFESSFIFSIFFNTWRKKSFLSCSDSPSWKLYLGTQRPKPCVCFQLLFTSSEPSFFSINIHGLRTRTVW